ncbi:hypothetical protein JKP88DRAFT_273140 [Tribonema minus]|uniref:SET domain-containing protein n=1 Tax=Tribonema minus TaxID=303371 RepID=A0A836CFD4_9STRA|nr:hypothetical protein JKP88DRAFT_273140 [Tribonema minus]
MAQVSELLREQEQLFRVGPSVVAEGERGLFAARDLRGGELVTYVVVPRVAAELADRYSLVGYWSDEEGAAVPQPHIAFDGSPSSADDDMRPPTRDFGALMNESSRPNCILMLNPVLSRETVETALATGTEIVGALMVVVEPLRRGQEVLTFYGTLLRRDYEIDLASDAEALRAYRAKVDLAYDGLDAWIARLAGEDGDDDMSTDWSDESGDERITDSESDEEDDEASDECDGERGSSESSAASEDDDGEDEDDDEEGS